MKTLIEYEELSNEILLAHARSIHGVIYHRVNKLQVELNQARAEIENLRKKLNSERKFVTYKLVPIDGE